MDVGSQSPPRHRNAMLCIDVGRVRVAVAPEFPGASRNLEAIEGRVWGTNRPGVKPVVFFAKLAPAPGCELKSIIRYAQFAILFVPSCELKLIFCTAQFAIYYSLFARRVASCELRVENHYAHFAIRLFRHHGRGISGPTAGPSPLTRKPKSQKS